MLLLFSFSASKIKIVIQSLVCMQVAAHVWSLMILQMKDSALNQSVQMLPVR